MSVGFVIGHEHHPGRYINPMLVKVGFRLSPMALAVFANAHPLMRYAPAIPPTAVDVGALLQMQQVIAFAVSICRPAISPFGVGRPDLDKFGDRIVTRLHQHAQMDARAIRGLPVVIPDQRPLPLRQRHLVIRAGGEHAGIGLPDLCAGAVYWPPGPPQAASIAAANRIKRRMIFIG